MLPSELTIPQVTILTPTWNRRHLLPRLYDSLIAQQAPPGSFEWLVVDDGSTDGTFDWLETLIPGAPFPIRVIRQGNGGKHRAINRAASEITSPWFLIVDSDDWLLNGAMKLAVDSVSTASPQVRAIIAPLEIDGWPPRSFEIGDRLIAFADFLKQKQRVGDTSYIIRTALLQRNPFPEFPNEIYMAQSYLYGAIFSDGGIEVTNVKIMGAQYQLDGLSAKSLQLRMNNPLGAIANYKAQLGAGISGGLWVRSCINYHRFFWHAQRRNKRPESYGFEKEWAWLAIGYLVFVCDNLRTYFKN